MRTLAQLATTALIGALIALPCSPSHSQDTDPFDELADALFYHMAGTFICREALGGMAQYQAARTITIENLAPYIGRDNAVLRVDEMDHRFRTDPLSYTNDIDPDLCMERVNESRYAIGVAKARMRN